jgi:Dyp-type peroxidase family
MDDVLELDDIQGLVARGYGSLPYACFLPMAIHDPVPVRRVLSRWAEQVTSARGRPDSEATNIAFTAAGLCALTGWADLPEGFSYPFIDGMTSEYRSRFLGDLEGENPRHWRWGGPSTAPVHLVVLLYGRTAESLRARVDALVAEATGEGLEVIARLESDELSNREPFGFTDSISQPPIAGFSGAQGPSSAIRTGEFVLGYRNEYGQLTERPSVPATEDPKGYLARDDDGSADLGRNGTYLVLRQIEQDVAGFWRYLEDESRLPDGTVDRWRRDYLAAKVVGRWTSGAPLVLAPDEDDPAAARNNDFRYHATDPDGLACPIGAHIRRVNPRDALEPAPGTERSIQVNNRHRLLRRSRSYRMEQPVEAAPAEERGLYFVCLNANLARQYEFIQHTWINNPMFNGRYGETDPLVGIRPTGGATFTEPALPVRRRHRGLPQFIKIHGGAYFFLPGRSALQYLTSPITAKGLS